MTSKYERELEQLNHTYMWSLKATIEKLKIFIEASYGSPLIAVGSGGSLVAAHMAALLHQTTGALAKAMTPFELISSDILLRETSVLILSAGGRNVDAISAFNHAATSEAYQLMAMCSRSESSLADLRHEFQYSQIFDFDLPSGKDGFLATNSLLAFFVLLLRTYTFEPSSDNSIFPEKLTSLDETREEISTSLHQLLGRGTLIVLHGKWGQPAAVDAESKLVEASLKNVQVADYRNFGHGRHHWLAKRGEETGVIALVTPEDNEIAEKTLQLLPNSVPQLRLVTTRTGPVGSLDLLNRVFHLVHFVGHAQGIDPGKPGVPDFGRRLYHLKLPNKLLRSSSGPSHGEDLAILRKCRCSSLDDLPLQHVELWRLAYRSYLGHLAQTRFSSIVFDYDGTLCGPADRFDGISPEINRELNRLLAANITIGIATGRGRSVRVSLQNSIPAEYWHSVIVGYYNGAEIARLSDTNHPERDGETDSGLAIIQNRLQHHPQFDVLAKCEFRPKQITIEPVERWKWPHIRAILMEIIQDLKVEGIRVLESSHSIDVVSFGVSKSNVVAVCEAAVIIQNQPHSTICIGDRGAWPGNDYDLLSSPYSLSVDTVSSNPMSCWNIANAGHRGVQATTDYLKLMEIEAGLASFNIKGM